MNNLPTAREIRNMTVMMLALQATNNRPSTIKELMDGLYGKPTDYSEEEAVACADELAQILTTCYRLGWITNPFLGMRNNHPEGGTVMLTDIGDEKATAIRVAMEQAGIPIDTLLHEALHGQS